MSKGSILDNVLSLAAIQAADYLVPLLSIPYLLRVLGATSYGEIALAQACCAYFIVLVEYGFNYSATKAASVARHDLAALSAVFWNVQAAKLLLVIASLMIVAVATVLVATPSLATLLWIGMLTVVGNLLYPLWFLQAVERMRDCAIIMLSVRITLLALIFLLVKSESDQMLSALLLFAPTSVAGVLALLLVHKAGLVQRTSIGWGTVRRALEDGRHTFFATAASTLYRSSNAVVVGLVSNSASVAYYAIAEKVVRAVQELVKPITRATYPRVSALVAERPSAAVALLRRMLVGVSAVSLVAAILLAFEASRIMGLIGGAEFAVAAPVLQVMAFIPAVGAANSVLGLHTMVPFGFEREFSRFVLAAGLVNLALVFPLVYAYDAVGAGIGYLVSELLLLILVSRFLRRTVLPGSGGRP